jgi:hypothetical protein
MKNRFKNVVLSDRHSQALLERAVAEGFIGKTGKSFRRTTSPVSTSKMLAEEVINAVLSHERIILTGVWPEDYDFRLLESEDLFAAPPANLSSALLSIGNEIKKPSPTMDQLAERALILEPLLLKWFWNYLCSYSEN